MQDMQCQHTCNNCGCTVAIIQGCLSIVNEEERLHLSKKLQNQWQSPEAHYWRPTVLYTAFKCRIFIHQAKVRPGSDRNGLCDPYVRVMICSNATETPVLYATLSPIWNAVISIDYVKLPGSIHWNRGNCAPIVAIELYDTDKNTADDYLGLGMLPVAVIPAQKDDTEGEGHYGEFGVLKNKHALDKFQALDSLSPPPLKWIPISISGATRAEILMSAELVELSQESDIDQVTKTEPLVIVGIPTAIRPTIKNYV